MERQLRYFGKKDLRYMTQFNRILPLGTMETVVDCCTGSGSLTVGLPYRDDVNRRIGFELSRPMYYLLTAIRDCPNALVEKILELEMRVDKEWYQHYRKIKKNAGTVDDAGLVETAAAVYMLLALSFNSAPTGGRRKINLSEDADIFKKLYMESQLRKITEDALYTIPVYSKALRNVEILNESFLGDSGMELIKHGGESTLCVLDVPYEPYKRGLSSPKRPVREGYDEDWSQDDHRAFVRFLKGLDQASSARIIICSNCTIDNRNRLIGIEDDLYVRELLPLGWRMVVLERRYTCEIKHGKCRKSKQPKAEVLFINYKDLICSPWTDVEYYDYEDIFL